MYIEDYHLPDDISDDPEAQRVLGIYEQILPCDPETEILFDSFDDGQEVFVARDDDTKEVLGWPVIIFPGVRTTRI